MKGMFLRQRNTIVLGGQPEGQHVELARTGEGEDGTD